jgi:hypothetical protein
MSHSGSHSDSEDLGEDGEEQEADLLFSGPRTWAELEADDGAVVLARSGGAEQPPSSSSGLARSSAGADVMDAEVCDPLTGQPLRLPHTRGHQVRIRRDCIPKQLLLTKRSHKP